MHARIAAYFRATDKLTCTASIIRSIYVCCACWSMGPGAPFLARLFVMCQREVMARYWHPLLILRDVHHSNLLTTTAFLSYNNYLINIIIINMINYLKKN